MNLPIPTTSANPAPSSMSCKPACYASLPEPVEGVEAVNQFRSPTYFLWKAGFQQKNFNGHDKKRYLCGNIIDQFQANIMAQTEISICNLLIINTLMGGGKTRIPISVFPHFHLKNDSTLRLTFCRAAFGVQSPKGSPLSLSKWRMEKGKHNAPSTGSESDNESTIKQSNKSTVKTVTSTSSVSDNK